MGHYIYIVECSDNTLYTGYTTDIDRRISEHNKGIGAKYTRGRGPVRLRYSQSFDSRGLAQKREYRIKQMKRKDKLRLIKGEFNG